MPVFCIQTIKQNSKTWGLKTSFQALTDPPSVVTAGPAISHVGWPESTILCIVWNFSSSTILDFLNSSRSFLAWKPYSKPDVQNRKLLKYILGHYEIGNVPFMNMMFHFSLCLNFVILVVKGGQKYPLIGLSGRIVLNNKIIFSKRKEIVNLPLCYMKWGLLSLYIRISSPNVCLCVSSCLLHYLLGGC